MAALTTQQRAQAMALYHQAFPEGETIAVTKADLRAAFDALDDFLVTNAAAINSAIPQPARAALTVVQKARLLRFVIQKRYETGA